MLINIVLDLDETLIHAVDKVNISKIPLKYFSLLKHHLFENYIIFERPYLKYFLQELCAKYTVSVWTAAHEIYAKFVIQNIILPYIPKCDLKFVFAANVCKDSERATGIGKHLDMLYLFPELGNFKRNNTALIDNNSSYLAQNNIVIEIKDFTLNPDDSYLVTTLELLKKI